MAKFRTLLPKPPLPKPQPVEHQALSADRLSLEDLRAKFRYKVRARFVGSLYWACPSCGHPNRSRLVTAGYRVRCGSSKGDNVRRGDEIDDTRQAKTFNAACRKWYTVGLRLLWNDRTGPVSRPEDSFLLPGLAEAYPEGDLGRWMSRWPAHQLVLVRTEDEDRGMMVLEGFLDVVMARVERMVRRVESRGMAVGKRQRQLMTGMVFEQVLKEWQVE